MSTIQISANGPISIVVDGVAYVPAGGPVVPPVVPPVIPPYVPPTTPPSTDPNAVPPITVKPAPFASLGKVGGPVPANVGARQVVGVDFTIFGPSYSRNLQWFGSSGQYFNTCSWAIFDSGGNKVFGQDNVPYGAVDYRQFLQYLGAGTYTLATAFDIAVTPINYQWQQSPSE